MKPRRNRARGRAMLALPMTSLLTSGCSSSDDEYRQFVEEMSRRQAVQQESLLRQSENLSETSRQLVEADAAARGEMVEMQSRLQQEFEAERRSIDGQRDKLDDERRDIAAQRHRDPLIGSALMQAATLLVAALPLVLLWLLIRAGRDEPDDAPLAELLVYEFSTDKPLLLLGPPQSAAAALPTQRNVCRPTTKRLETKTAPKPRPAMVDVEHQQKWDSRGHFFATAEAMRRILVDNARCKRRLKRGGEQQRVPLEPAAVTARRVVRSKWARRPLAAS